MAAVVVPVQVISEEGSEVTDIQLLCWEVMHRRRDEAK